MNEKHEYLIEAKSGKVLVSNAVSSPNFWGRQLLPDQKEEMVANGTLTRPQTLKLSTADLVISQPGGVGDKGEVIENPLTPTQFLGKSIEENEQNRDGPLLPTPAPEFFSGGDSPGGLGVTAKKEDKNANVLLPTPNCIPKSKK